ncbi:MAG: glycosyltransferase [Cyanobacteria bacterium]|jgi:glycosyltransferase involved in cell wall biosynthesis|nr:glycosyltransferase [Cyanobacteria bacterium GSL.Bin1]
MSLKILFVSPVGELGGAEKVFLSLIEHLPKWQIEAILACMRPGPIAELAKQKGAEVYEFKPHRYRQIKTVWEGIEWLFKVVKNTDVKLIHSNHTGHAYSGLASQFAKVPEVWHLHDYPYHFDWVDKLLKRIPAAHIIFTTNKVKSGYPELHRLPNSVIAPSCINPDHLRNIPHQFDIRAKHNLPPDPMFLTVTRMQEHKGHRYLLDAVPLVLKKHPNTIFVITGKPNGKQQENYMQELLARVESFDIQKQVKFLGYVSEEDLSSLYREASAIVHPALSEGFGLVLLEAMLLGTPVIAAAADGPSELIADSQTGLLVPPADSEKLAKAMMRLLNTPNLARTLSDQGMVAAEKLSVDKMVEATVNVYRSLVGSSE